MPTIESVYSDAIKLNTQDIELLSQALERMLTLSSISHQIKDDVKENRFYKGQVCPRCQSEHIVRNGTQHNKQRYICKSCKRTFTDFTNSPIHSSKKPLTLWIQFAQFMIANNSLRAIAKILGINLSTAFFWRHKILDAIAAYVGVGHVDGIVEADETFFLESFKGNHSNSNRFKLPREPRKRGSKASKRGISNEQICVCTAVDRTGNIIIEPTCKGPVTKNHLEQLYGERISNDSIFCTDSHRSYAPFARNHDLEHYRIPSGKHKQGIFHINHINSFHSLLKGWIMRFKGVSTKYLRNYMYWFKWLQLFKNERFTMKGRDLIIQAATAVTTTTVASFKVRPATLA